MTNTNANFNNNTDFNTTGVTTMKTFSQLTEKERELWEEAIDLIEIEESAFTSREVFIFKEGDAYYTTGKECAELLTEELLIECLENISSFGVVGSEAARILALAIKN